MLGLTAHSTPAFACLERVVSEASCHFPSRSAGGLYTGNVLVELYVLPEGYVREGQTRLVLCVYDYLFKYYTCQKG